MGKVDEPKRNQSSSDIRTLIIPEELVMILMQLLVPSNNINDDDDDDDDSAGSSGLMNGYRWRLRLIDSMKELRNLHGQYQKSNDASLENSPQPQEKEGQSSLEDLMLRIEPHLQQLRKDVHEFTTLILPQERQQILSLHQQLTFHQHQRQQHQQPAIYFFLQRLLSEHQLQWQYEAQMVTQVLYPTLDTCYNDDESTNCGNTNVSLQFCIQILRRLWTIQQQEQYFHDNIELLLNFLQDDAKTIDENDHHSMQSRQHTTAMSLKSFHNKLQHYYAPTQNQSQNHARNRVSMENEAKAILQINVNERVADIPPFYKYTTDSIATVLPRTGSGLVHDIIQDLLYFIRETKCPSNEYVVKTILIIGTDGSGKTSLCKQLEEQLSFSMPSTISGMK